mmetsp:Transcript_29039/g.39502  ORF Transcript_29039/g.39502 Transcript_29039/m.39502 type:complete len:124 (+) Transcript_29039:604-975(+)
MLYSNSMVKALAVVFMSEQVAMLSEFSSQKTHRMPWVDFVQLESLGVIAEQCGEKGAYFNSTRCSEIAKNSRFGCLVSHGRRLTFNDHVILQRSGFSPGMKLIMDMNLDAEYLGKFIYAIGGQ